MQAQDYQSKRGRIKDQAAVLFAAKGFHGTSIIDIATACRTVKSRLYYYFPSKRQLLYEIIKDHAQFLVDTLLPILDDKTAPAHMRLENYAKALLAVNVKYRDHHKLILGELSVLEPAQFREINFLLKRTIEALYPTLSEINPKISAQKHLKFPTAMMFVGMINWTHTWYDGEGELDPDGFAALLCTTFLDGYRS